MNDLTRRLVEKAAKKNPALAKRNDADFHFVVYDAYCDHVVDVVAQGLMERACRLWKTFHPEHFDADGYILDYEPLVYDIEVKLSEIVMRLAWQVVGRTPELKLDDWQVMPEIIANPQMRLF